MQRFTVPGKGGDISAVNFGRPDGPIDVVFLHATGFCALTYRRLLEMLGPQHRAVALDLRGHGFSTLPAHPGRLTSWDTYADDVIATIRQLAAAGPAPRLIAGHSMGGTVSLLALAREPGLAQALLLIDPALVPRQIRRMLLLPFGPRVWSRRMPLARGAARRRARFASTEEVLSSYRGRGAFRTWQPGFLEDYVEGGFARHADGSVVLCCAPAWESATFAAQRHDLRAALRRLRAPAHLIMAERGSTSARALPMLRTWAPALTYETAAGSTHFVPMEQPELVCDRMLRLLTPSTGSER